ncbi:hypothetical protein K501DRAFT_279402 [Backusella circina FSU 941]|nr:hypothetical protein K501DRAFT_279402 [Backusella circina FSU 941]
MYMIQRSCYATKSTKLPKVIPNRIPWSNKDTELLKSLVAKHGRHWTFLETFFENRTANMLSSRYYYLEKKDNRVWTATEDKLLLSKLDQFGDDWDRIEKEFEGQRTRGELEARYPMIKKTVGYKYSHWSKLETHKLLVYAKKYEYNWERVSEKMDTRSKMQCYNRFKRIEDIFNPEDDENIKITKEEATKLINGVATYGLKFRTIRSKLRLKATADELEQVYRTQVDPTFSEDNWTEEEMKLLVDLYRELEGHMKLVQTRLPKKRSLYDMWDHYYIATQDI